MTILVSGTKTPLTLILSPGGEGRSPGAPLEAASRSDSGGVRGGNMVYQLIK